MTDTSKPSKPGLFYFIVAIVISLLGVGLFGVGVYVAICGTGWSDGFFYISFGLTALIAASSFATVRGQMIVQEHVNQQISQLVAASESSASVDSPPLKFPERLRVLFTGRSDELRKVVSKSASG